MTNTALSSSRFKHRVIRAVSGVAAASALLIGFTGYLHTKSGRPLLMKIAGVMGCPMASADPVATEKVRAAAVAVDRGTTVAPARLAMGFSLEQSTIADVRKWEGSRDVSCSEERGGTMIRCNDVNADVIGRPASEPAITELLFGFTVAGKLEAITVLESNRTPDLAQESAQRTYSEVKSTLGNPHVLAGSFDAAGTTATARYRYADYAVDITMTPVPGSGCVVRERYAAIPRT